jgi:hypothetical protein
MPSKNGIGLFFDSSIPIRKPIIFLECSPAIITMFSMAYLNYTYIPIHQDEYNNRIGRLG